MPEREYKLTSTRGVVNFLPGPLIFRMRNGHLWIGTTPQRGARLLAFAICPSGKPKSSLNGSGAKGATVTEMVWVLKMDSLAGGKGVYVGTTLDEVIGAATTYLRKHPLCKVTIESAYPLGPDGGGS